VELVHKRLDVLPPDGGHGGRHAGALEEGGQLVDRLPVRLDGAGIAGRPRGERSKSRCSALMSFTLGFVTAELGTLRLLGTHRVR
jgi:hypothetical protein